MTGVVDHVVHTPYSDPGPHRQLLDAVPPSVDAVSAMARNVVAHYRARARELPESSRDDVELRWVGAILDVDQRRHPGVPLSVERPIAARVQGCCRDHTLLAVAALRQHGVPARSRVGFASYLDDTPWNHDHVIVEAWLDHQWRRFDPELPDADMDGFRTAAAVWSGYRLGQVDATMFGVADGVGIDGDWFVHGYVIRELAHRFGDELLLWDVWGAMTGDVSMAPPEHVTLVDEVAALLLAADGGDVDAEGELLRRYRADDRLHPGDHVQSWSPTGNRYEVDLAARRAVLAAS